MQNLRSRKAFTLIELLVVIAIIAILAAILFPVFAQAKSSAKVATALSQIKQVGLGMHIYAVDYDDRITPSYGYTTEEEPYIYHNENTWVYRIFPYVKNQEIFFDPMDGVPQPDLVLEDGREAYSDPGYDGYLWGWVTSFAINAEGYAHPGTGDCLSGGASNYAATRSLSAIDNISDRIAIAPTRYASRPYSWMYFRDDAIWPYIDEYATGWSTWNQVWDSRREYPNAKMVGAMADGSARKFGREMFIGYSSNDPSLTDANNRTEFCEVYEERELGEFWGNSWDAS
jgi:prepilin-type N-terminal cleavage/methylation domain-containing protein